MFFSHCILFFKISRFLNSLLLFQGANKQLSSSQQRYCQPSHELPPFLHQQAIENPCPRRSHPAQYGADRFGPPTLERSGSEHRVGRFPPSLLRFLSPANGGTEGGVKTIEERLGERSGALLKVKEERVGFRKSQWVHEFTDKYPVWEEGMKGNRARLPCIIIRY